MVEEEQRRWGGSLTKEELKRISINNRKLGKLKEKCDSLRGKSQTKGQVITGMPHVSGISDIVGDYVLEVTELAEEILLLEMETDLLLKGARNFIKDIPDYIIQDIIGYKYINRRVIV